LYDIMAREDFSTSTFLVEILHPRLARSARPGQFVIAMSHADGERIPLTIADFSADRGTVTLVVQAVGKTTRQMQRSWQVGASLHALAGPMGNPSEIGAPRTVVCIGGGLGVAPVFPIARALKEAGARVIGIVGFRSRELIFWQDRFSAVCDELIICTDDGSAGIKGLVTDGLREVMAREPVIDEVIAIGPPVMMKFCAEATRPQQIKTTVSLNPIMIDGTGMCGGCRVTIGGETRFCCVDGPEFDGHQVDFDEVMRRLARFRPEEQQALDRWQAGEPPPAEAQGAGA
jgi:sulfide dehydrogenase subunit beta